MLTCFEVRRSATTGRYQENTTENRKTTVGSQNNRSVPVSVSHTKLQVDRCGRESLSCTTGCQGLQAVRDYRVSGATGCQRLQAVRGYRVSGSTGCHELQGVRGYRLSGATCCQRLQGVRGYRLSEATGCQGLQGVRG